MWQGTLGQTDTRHSNTDGRRHCIQCSSVAVCIAVCLSVPVSLATFPHFCTDQHNVGGMVGVPYICSLFGGFAISARVSLYMTTYTANAYSAKLEISASDCTRSMVTYTFRVSHL